jgi:hypothetical protein
MVRLAFSVKRHSLGFMPSWRSAASCPGYPNWIWPMWGRGGGEESARITALITFGCGGGGGEVCEQTCPTSTPATLSPSSSIALSLWLAVRPSLDDKLDGDDPNKPKNSEKNYFCWHLKIHWRKGRIQIRSWIRIQIRICKPVVQIRRSGSVPKCHGSTTLLPAQWQRFLRTLSTNITISFFNFVSF